MVLPLFCRPAGYPYPAGLLRIVDHPPAYAVR